MVIADNSNKEIITFSQASSNAYVIGEIDLASAIGNAYTGGSASTIRLSTMNTENNFASFENTDAEVTSGTVENEQDHLSTIILDTALSNDSFDLHVDLQTSLRFFVKDKPTATTFTVNSADLSGEMLSGNTFRLYSVIYSEGRAYFKEIQGASGQVTLTANSSHSSGVITFTVSSGDNAKITVGYLIVKENEVRTKVSIKGSTVNDDFTGAYRTPDSMPVKDIGIGYLAPRNVAAHFLLGGVNSTDATRNRQRTTGVMPNLNLLNSGPSSFGSSFKNGQLGATGFNTNNGFYIVKTDIDPVSWLGNGPISYSIWLKDRTGTAGAQPWYPLTQSNAATNGIYITRGGTNQLQIQTLGGFGPQTHPQAYVPGEWFHFVITRSTTNWTYYVNGVKASFTGGTVASANNFEMGAFTASATNRFVDGEMADFAIFTKILTEAEVLAIYRQGAHGPFGVYPGAMKHIHNLTGQTGDKVSVLNNIVRQVNTHHLQINKVVGA